MFAIVYILLFGAIAEKINIIVACHYKKQTNKLRFSYNTQILIVLLVILFRYILSHKKKQNKLSATFITTNKLKACEFLSCFTFHKGAHQTKPINYIFIDTQSHQKSKLQRNYFQITFNIYLTMMNTTYYITVQFLCFTKALHS